MASISASSSLVEGSAEPVKYVLTNFFLLGSVLSSMPMFRQKESL